MVKANLHSYAIALFDIAPDDNCKERYFDQVLKIDQTNLSCPDFFKVLCNRAIDKQERKQLAYDVLSELAIDESVIHWVWVLIDDNIYYQFNDIAKECRLIHHKIFNIIDIKIATARDLEQSLKSKLEKYFTSKMKQKVEFVYSVDQSLIGGIKIQINNKTYNNTFKNRLEELKKYLFSKKGKGYGFNK